LDDFIQEIERVSNYVVNPPVIFWGELDLKKRIKFHMFYENISGYQGGFLFVNLKK